MSLAVARAKEPQSRSGYTAIYRNVVLPAHCVLRRRSTLRWYELAKRQQELSSADLANFASGLAAFTSFGCCMTSGLLEVLRPLIL